MSLQSVKNSQRLLAITQAVNPVYLERLNRIDWLSRDWRADDHWYADSTFRRRILNDRCDLMQAIDLDILKMIPDINRICGTQYFTAGPIWHLCESGFVCPMHTDGHKRNVMIIYWQTPGSEFGTTFYNTKETDDVFWEFPGEPNTGFFANYEPGDDGEWPQMWHASLQPVPANGYRLMTQYELL